MSLDPNAELCRILEAHGLAVAAEGERLRPAGGPALDAAFFDQGSVVQLDVRIYLDDGRTLVESFAGWGQGPAAARGQALASFMHNALHPLLAAFYGLVDPDQVTVEEWTVGGARWQATIGNVGINSADPAPDLPTGLFPAVEAALRALPLSAGTHWFRVFFGQWGGQPRTFEGLLDNDSCVPLEDALRSQPWPLREGYYSARLFGVIRVGKWGRS